MHPYPMDEDWRPQCHRIDHNRFGPTFIGAVTDSYFRAFDIPTGQVVWKARLPNRGQATPMAYRLREMDASSLR